MRLAASLGAFALFVSTMSAAAVLAGPVSPAAAAEIPTVGCTTDPAIFNTGYDAATGGQAATASVDARWTVAGGVDGLNHVTTTTAPVFPSPAALPPAGTTYAPAYVGKVNNAWSDSQSGASQWISANYVDPATGGQNQSTGYGDWYYRYQFMLDPAVDTSSFQLDMSWLADNSVVGVWVNDQAQNGANLPQNPANPYVGGGFLAGNAATTSLTTNWQTGLNTILVQVKSYYTAEGFSAEVRSNVLCPNPGYTVAKSASAPSVKPGETLTYTVKVTNTGNVDYSAQNPATISDDLSGALDDATYNGDAAVVFSDGSTSASPAVAGSTLTWSGPLKVGETATITYSVTVRSPNTGDNTLTNAVTPGTNGGSCASASDCTTSTPVQSYSVTKTANASAVVPGATVVYTITVKNTGQVDYTDQAPASFTDDLSAVLDDATYNGDASNGASYAAPTLSWSGPLAVGATHVVTYSVTVNTPPSGDSRLENTVVTPPGNGGDCDPDSGNPACSANIPTGSYTVAKKASTTTAREGDTVTYTVTVTNTGQVDYTTSSPASFADDLSGVLDDATVTTGPDNGATITGNTLSWSGALPVGQTSTITYTVTINTPDTGNRVLTNVVQPQTPGGSCVDGECSTTTNVQSFSVAKTSTPDGAVHPGDTVTYAVTVVNTGTAPFTAQEPASFTDDLSSVLDDARVTTAPDNGATITGTTLSWSGPLAVGEQVIVTYTVTVNDPDLGDKTLTNSVVPGDGGRCIDGGCVTTNPVQSYTVAKTASGNGIVHPGDTVTYTVTVTNTGQAAYTASTPATVSDDLSKVLDDATYVAGSATNGATVTGATLTWSGPLAVGAAETITYQVVAGPAGSGDGTLTNVVVGDPDNGGGCATAGGCETTTLLQSYTTLKTADVTTVVPGTTVTYTISVENTGQVAYTAGQPASFTDDLTAVLDDATYNDDATAGAAYAAPTLSWSGPLAVGQTVTVTYSVTVNTPDTGDKVLRNTVVTPPDNGGGCAPGSTDPACTVTIPSGSYTTAKSASATKAAPGDVVIYTITVTNTGKAAYTADAPATFTDDMGDVLDDATFNGDATQGAVLTGTTLSWAGPLEVGQTLTVTYSVTVNNPDAGNKVLHNTVAGGTCDPAGSCETTTTITPPPSLAVTGGDVLTPGLIALGLLGSGAVLVLIRRRRIAGE